jgi:FkbM family methyltransferase
MSLIDCRDEYQTGKIGKPDYIDAMYHLHTRLFEYANFIKQTDISGIEIQDNKLIMTVRNSGIKLLCESLDKRAAPIEILNFNSYEQTDSNMIFNLLEPNMVFFDIGANIGWYSINVAKRQESIKVYSFEPIPQTFTILKSNIALNNIFNANLYNMGFSDSDQELTFYFDPLSSGSASARNLLENADIQKIVSPVTTLDSFFIKNNFQQLDFIKCDVEGAELFVFRGGLESIKKHQPIIFTEMLRKWSAKFNYHPNEIISLLTVLGYRCFTAKEEKLIEFYRMDENTIETNFFFLHGSKHVSQIKRLAG